MLIFLILLNMAIMFLFMTHPLSMGLTLLVQTTAMAMATGMLSTNFWFSYIMFLIMVGGMLVLFIYMTSIASNEKFKFSSSLYLYLTFMMTMIITMTFMNDQSMITNNDMILPMNKKMNMYTLLNKFLSFPSSMIYIVIINYLLLALIATVKITQTNYGPLRKM